MANDTVTNGNGNGLKTGIIDSLRAAGYAPVRDAAKGLGVPVGTIHTWRNKGHVDGIRVGQELYVNLESVKKYKNGYEARKAAADALKNGNREPIRQLADGQKTIGNMTRGELESIIANAVEAALRKAL